MNPDAVLLLVAGVGVRAGPVMALGSAHLLSTCFTCLWTIGCTCNTLIMSPTTTNPFGEGSTPVQTSQGRARDSGPAQSEEGPDQLVRLSVNLSPAVAAVLKSYAGRKGISVTEAVRRAISILKYIDDAQERGASLNVEEAGALKEVQFLV